MNKGTLAALGGCMVTLVALGAAVTYAESLLPRELKEEAAVLERSLIKERAHLQAVQATIATYLEKQGDVPGGRVKDEKWLGRVSLALTALKAASVRYTAEAAPMIARNDREEEGALIELLVAIEHSVDEAVQDAATIETQLKELVGIGKRAEDAVSEQAKLVSATAALASSVRAQVDAATTAHPGIAAVAAKLSWGSACKTAGVACVSQTSELGRLSTKTSTGNASDARSVLHAIEKLKGEIHGPHVALTEVRKRCAGLVHFLKEKDRYLAQAEENVEFLQKLDASSVEERAQELSKRYPFNAAEIQRRAHVAAFTKAEGERLGALIQTLASKKLTEFDPSELYAAANRLSLLRANAKKQLAALAQQLNELDHHEEVVLIDMEVRDGYLVSFRHRLMTVRADYPTFKVSVKRDWKSVNKATYQKHTRDLGMALKVKPLGYFTGQGGARSLAPGGFACLNNPLMGSWQGEGPKRTWAFNQNAQDLQAAFWGSHYRAPTYDDYERARSGPRTFTGHDAFGHVLYGSTGSLTRRQYATATYLTSKGWITTRWVRSGGRWKGTKFDPPPKRTTTVIVGGSSGPRSRGGYSSGYRGK